MTPATLAETILRDVKRYSLNMLAIEMYETPHGGWVKLPAVEAALSRALEPALSERAREVLEQLGVFVNPQWSTGAPAYVCTAAADLITDLLTANAALLAERDELAAAIDSIETSHGLTSNGNLWRFFARKACDIAYKAASDRKAAEAQIAALTARVEGLTGALAAIVDHDLFYDEEWLSGELVAKFKAARAALSTTEEGK